MPSGILPPTAVRVLPSAPRCIGPLFRRAVVEVPLDLPPGRFEIGLDLSINLVVRDLANARQRRRGGLLHLFRRDDPGVQQAVMAAPTQVVAVLDAELVAV